MYECVSATAYVCACANRQACGAQGTTSGGCFFFFFFCHVGPRDGTQGAGVVAGVFIHGAILLALILLYCINDLLKSQGNAQDKGSL